MRLGHAPGVIPQRQARLVSETDEELVVEDVRWGGHDTGGKHLEFRFQTTTVRLDRIVEVFWWSENFDPKWLAAHGQLVFAVDARDGFVGADGSTDPGFVFSVEAHLRQGQSYSMLRGLHPRGEFGIIHMLSSVTDRIQRSALLFGHTIDAFRLRLDPHQKRELARMAIRSATTPRADQRYHTTRKNCVSETVKVLNEVLPESRRLDVWAIPGLLANLKVTHPKWTPRTLVEAGLAEPFASWDEKVRTVSFPQSGGPPVTVDVLSLPGSKVPKGARALESALHHYITAAQSVRALEAALRGRGSRLGGKAGRRAPRTELEAELATTRSALDANLEAVVDFTVAEPAVTVPFLLSLERPDTPQARTLIGRLTARLAAERDAGRWVPTPEQAAALAELSG